MGYTDSVSLTKRIQPMLITFLLQTTRTVTFTDGILPAVYGTLIASVLSLAASFYATITASKTSEKVANLAAQTAQELKEKDRKNDFYKTIITRRLAAWEKVEIFMGSITSGLIDDSDNKRFMEYCADGEKFDTMMLNMQDLAIGQVFWIGKSFSEQFAELYNKNNEIRKISVVKNKERGFAPLDNELLLKAGKAYYEDCVLIIHDLLRILREEVIAMDNVEAFLQNTDHIGLEIGD